MQVDENLALQKYEALKHILAQTGGLAVAFSGGVDSTLLLKAAHEALGSRVIALTARGCWFPQRESGEAMAFCQSLGVRQLTVTVTESDIPGFAQNPPNRCYLCKHRLFEAFLKTAAEQGLHTVAEGSNMDDLGDYRPGLQAIAELGVVSPLRAAGLYKDEIRFLSKRLGLPTWAKPSFACLASRFAYGEPITSEKLAMVEKAEQLLLDMGFTQMRVRVHGSLARIELLPADIDRALSTTVRAKITEELKTYGFQYVALDLQGYRIGSMNEVLNQKN